MKLSRTNSNNSGYWPDDLPCPSSNTTTVEVHYLQCGCTLQDTSSDSLTAFYGDVESWSPTPSTQLQNRSSDATNTHPRPISPASSDRSRSQSVDAPIVRRVVDSWFCEKATCNRSKVFNREWNRLWQEHNSEMKQALDDQVEFEAFKARIRREAKEVTEGLLGRMPEVSA